MFMSLAQKRRSIRKFLDKPIETEKIDLLIEAGLRAPSSRGFQPWSFILVDDKKLLEGLSRSKAHGSSFIKNAPLGIVICADPDLSDVWVEDTSIAAIFFQMEAESLGLGSCWIQIRERMHDSGKSAQEFVCQLLDIPPKLRVPCLIAVGYPAEEKAPHKKETLPFTKVSLNRYGNLYSTGE